MGLIKLAGDVIGSATGALGGAVNAAMFKEYFESGDMSDGILMKRADRIVTAGSKNTRSDDNLITSGSVIDVQEGQCMIIVESGKIVEFCAEPGPYKYDSSASPSLFYGDNKGLKAAAGEFLAQWSAGGQRLTTQRVYFINLGELIAQPIKWGCGDVPFHHAQVYRATGSVLEMDMTLKVNGQATVKIDDPVKFFKVIGAQKVGSDTKAIIRVNDDGILSNLKAGLVDHISTAISNISYEQQIPYTAIKSKDKDIKAYINNELANEWGGQRGFVIANLNINAPVPSDKNREDLENLQNSFNISQNTVAANYDIQKTMARGVEAAGQNGGAAGLFGVGMGMGAVGAGNWGNLQGQTPAQVNPQPPMGPAPAAPVYATAAPAAAPAPADAWTCPTCGATMTGNFCHNCGSKKPEPVADGAWTCSCGNANPAGALYCSKCGSKKPDVKRIMKCDKCGWEATLEEATGMKFCPKCGDPITEADFQ